MIRIYKLTTFIAALSLSLVFAEEPARRVASIATFEGGVAVKRAVSGEVELITRKRTPLFENDKIKTAKDGSATILFADGSRVDMASETGLAIVFNGRQREIAVSQGSLKSDIKKLPGQRTMFRTPAGVAAVKGTLVDLEVKSDSKIEISADLGLLTHQVGETETSADIEKGQKLSIGFEKASNTISAKSLVGMIDVKTKNLTTSLEQDVEVSSQVDKSSDKVTLEVQSGIARTRTTRGTQVMMSQDDRVDFVQSATGTTVTVVTGQITVIDSNGVRTKIEAGETAVELPGLWQEPETPEGFEVMIPPGA
ncbi:MAG: FecR family protein [Planctomycetota bacterium]|nr:FecR family protein [Planctomycetota bacterium]